VRERARGGGTSKEALVVQGSPSALADVRGRRRRGSCTPAGLGRRSGQGLGVLVDWPSANNKGAPEVRLVGRRAWAESEGRRPGCRSSKQVEFSRSAVPSCRTAVPACRRPAPPRQLARSGTRLHASAARRSTRSKVIDGAYPSAPAVILPPTRRPTLNAATSYPPGQPRAGPRRAPRSARGRRRPTLQRRPRPSCLGRASR
jgi:hypothetical protein